MNEPQHPIGKTPETDTTFIGRILKKLPADAVPFARFCIVGAVNTGIHYSVLTPLVAGFALAPGSYWRAAANVCAFLVANTFSYYANSKWSFGATLSRGNYARFFTTSVAGVVISWGVTRFGDAHGWHYLLLPVAQLPFMAVINFTLLRIFVFSDVRRRTDGTDGPV
ncbi:MAG: GtrA family protein [Puniceicoccales bacterium]|nr:GtrA family protein [Puniceicoccales bacterium]